VFHVELRQFPNTSRTFNLSPEQLHRRILAPWVEGRMLEVDEHKFSPEKARVTVYEGRELRVDEIGMGRGWGNVTRTGEDVTERVLGAAQQALGPATREEAVAELRERLLARAGGAGSLSFPEVLGFADERHPERRASERLALAEQAVWELLHTGGLHLERDGEPVASTEWQHVLFRWATWGLGDDVGDQSLALVV
jgi:hypothetical protein